jgi:MFS family permease
MTLTYISLTVLLCLFGAKIMSLEILSSSLMAPYFGGSIYVWGSIISSFMVHMSLGYVLGGYLAKKTGKISVLIQLLIFGSILTMLIPFYYRPLCEWVSDAVSDLRFGSLLAMSIISFPVLLMAMVSPYIIGILTIHKRHSGLSAGMVLFASTFGSFIGTNITAFYLMDLFPVSRIIIFLGLSGLLMTGILLFFRLDGRLASSAPAPH